MNVLVSGQFQDQARRNDVQLHPSLQEAVRILERLRPDTLLTNPMIRKVQGATEDIYVLSYRDVRFFLTIRGSDIVLIGINKA